MARVSQKRASEKGLKIEQLFSILKGDFSSQLFGQTLQDIRGWIIQKIQRPRRPGALFHASCR